MCALIKNFDICKEYNSKVYQLRTKTDVFIIEFDDIDQENIFTEIFSFLKQEGKECECLEERLKQNHDPSKVLSVLKMLNDYSLLSPNLESKNVNFKHSNKALSIFGQGQIAKEVKRIATEEHFQTNIYPYKDIFSEIEIDQIVQRSDFLIVDATEWSPFHIEIINSTSLKYSKPWLYIGGIENDVFKIGPLFYGKETGCYNCLIDRIKNNDEYSHHLKTYEQYLRNNKISSKPDIISVNHFPVYGIIANLAILDVISFFEDLSVPSTYRCLIEFNYLSLEIKRHELLKKPYCEVCKPRLQYNSAPWLETIITD